MITLSWKVGELQALQVNSPFLVFHQDTVAMFRCCLFIKDCLFLSPCPGPHSPYFLSLPSSDAEQTLHSLDVHKVLFFYVHRIAPFSRNTVTDKVKELLEVQV